MKTNYNLRRWLILSERDQSLVKAKRVIDCTRPLEPWAYVLHLDGKSVRFDFIQPVLDRIPVSRCVDIGHLWLDGHDPIPYLRAALQRTRVIHSHGIAERDHHSLACMPFEKVRAVWDELAQAKYAGVLTLEIFSEEGFLSSMEVVEKLSS